jgi:small-conductance mechanosensitive channel
MWDSIKRSLQDGAAIAFDKAEGLTQVGRARLDIAAAKTRLMRLKGELGAEVFTRLEAGEASAIAENDQIRGLCDQIREAAATLRASEEEFEQVRRQLQAADDDDTDEEQDAPPGT